MKILKYLSLFLLFNISTAQTDNSKAVQYENLIYQAETLITGEKYSEAAKAYDKAYEVNNYMFAIDIENALICNIQVKNWKKSVFLAEKLMMKGIEINFFNSERFKDLKKTKEWKKFLKRNKEIRFESQAGFNQALVDSLVVLMEYDQSEYSQLRSGKKMDDMIEVTDNINARLIKLVDKYGYPSEEKIGVNVYNDTILSPFSALEFDVLFRHSDAVSSNTSRPDLLAPIAKKAIDDVLVRIDLYENFMAGSSFTFILVEDRIYENPNFALPNPKTDLLRKKIIFKNTKNHAGFNFYTPLAIIGGAELEEQEWFKAEHTFLVKYKE